jgi:hypothetical protein
MPLDEPLDAELLDASPLELPLEVPLLPLLDALSVAALEQARRTKGARARRRKDFMPGTLLAAAEMATRIAGVPSLRP